MKLFAVRMIGTQEPVGFFWASNMETLAEDVDSICDPGECEYKCVTAPTAIVWSGTEGWKMGVQERPISKSRSHERDIELFERRAEIIKAGMVFDGPLADDGTLSDFLDGISDVGGWVRLVV